MANQANSPNTLFELAKLYAARCDFVSGVDKAKEAAAAFLEKRDFEHYLKCQNLLLRMYAEMENFQAINIEKERLQDFVLKENIQLNSKTYYSLGICSTYRGQNDIALEYFQKSLAIALSTDNKEDMCHAITGIAISYSIIGKFSEALREIYNLQVFFEVLDIPELKLSNQILNGTILCDLERYDQAIDIFWGCYETMRQEKNLYLYVHLLYAMGKAYRLMGEADLARIYLQLAKKTADPQNLVALTREINRALGEIGINNHEDYDIVFSPTSKSVVERKRGKIDFKNQFILLDLLHLFVRSPGYIFSKETIADKIWNQEYDPAIHDNKIYVTIKRLRKLIEPDIDKPKYIFRAKNGYYLNKNARILLENQ